MSNPDARNIAGALSEAAVTVLWRQWRAIGDGASGKAAQSGIVDPEALILASLRYRDEEPRLWTVMADWLIGGSRLISLQRLRNIAGPFAAGSSAALRDLALIGAGEARDARWKTFLGSGVPDANKDTGKRNATMTRRSAGPALDVGPALLLRFRAAFGVGLKADLLAFLNVNQVATSASSIARALGYSVPPVFRALQDLVSAGLARTLERPAATEYTVDGQKWSGITGELFPPSWRPWKETLAYAVEVRDAVARWEGRSVSDYAAAVELRRLGDHWWAGLLKSGIFVEGLAGRVRPPESADLSSWQAFNRSLARELVAWV